MPPLDVDRAAVGHDRDGQERRHHRERGGGHEQELVCPRRDDLFLEEELDAVRHRLEETEGTGAVRPQAELHEGQHAPLDVRHQREEAQQRGRGAQDRPVRPLPLGLHAQMLTDLVKGHFRLPAQHEPLDNLHRVHLQVRAQKRLGLEVAFRITNEHPADWQGRLTTMKPHRRLRDDLNPALPFAGSR